MLRETLIHPRRSDTAESVVTRSPLQGMARRFVPGEEAEDLAGSVARRSSRGLPWPGSGRPVDEED